MSKHDVRRFFFAVLLLLVGSPLIWADVWSLGHFFTAGGRTRIVQMCVVVMCLALFIMMKKING